MPNIIISFTTIPSRVENLVKILQMLMLQTISPTKIYISVPRFSKRENVEYPIDEIQKCYNINTKIIEVILLDEDYGPLCKLMGPLLTPGHPDDIIITIDDDGIYSSRLVESLLYSCVYEDSVYCMAGLQCCKGVTCGYYMASPNSANLLKTIDVLMGYGGVLYRRKFFPTVPNPVLEHLRKSKDFKQLHRHDDLYISAWLSMNNIRIRPAFLTGDEKFYTPINGPNPLCGGTIDQERGTGRGTPIQWFKYILEWRTVCKRLEDLKLLKPTKKNDVGECFTEFMKSSVSPFVFLFGLGIGTALLFYANL